MTDQSVLLTQFSNALGHPRRSNEKRGRCVRPRTADKLYRGSIKRDAKAGPDAKRTIA
jgi:hypothetical protein